MKIELKELVLLGGESHYTGEAEVEVVVESATRTVIARARVTIELRAVEPTRQKAAGTMYRAIQNLKPEIQMMEGRLKHIMTDDFRAGGEEDA